MHMAFLPAQHAYEVQAGLPVGSTKMAVLGLDSITIATQRMSEHQHGKKNFSGKIHKQGLVSSVLTSPDGLPKYVMNMTSSSSPTCTDERLMAHLMDLENPLNPLITGGLRSFLTGPLTVPAPGQPARHDFFTVLNIDLGNRFYICWDNK
jgi:hypothetical protein